MIVMMMAITPSLNASRRPLLTRPPVVRLEDNPSRGSPSRRGAFRPASSSFDVGVLPSALVGGRFMIHARHAQRPWVVIVEPDADVKLLVVVTVYEVSE